MKIRSITCFYDPASKEANKDLERLSGMMQEAKGQFGGMGMNVQSSRLATTPLGTLPAAGSEKACIQFVREQDARTIELGFDYLSLGPAGILEQGLLKHFPKILAEAEHTFLSAIIAEKESGMSLAAIQETAKTICEIAQVGNDGFANLRFAALANVAPFNPFFPAAYSQGQAPAFGFAMQCADEALQAFQQAKNLEEAQINLLKRLEKAATAMEVVTNKLAKKYGVIFKGFDFSPAPYPQDWCSLGAALEAVGVAKLGLAGSLAAAAFLADTLQKGQWLKTGFNGVMLPVLEDSRLATRSAEGVLGVYDLLLYSAVCGTGLDTVPLPGDISAKELEALLVDVAALALRLDKPLTARLMPIPGKHAGDATDFHFDYFANGRVMSYRATALQGLLAGKENLQLKSRH